MKGGKKTNQGGISCGLVAADPCLPEGGGGTYRSVWETHSLSFSHIVLLLFSGTPSPPALPSFLPSPKPLIPQKIHSPLCPWTAERSALVYREIHVSCALCHSCGLPLYITAFRVSRPSVEVAVSFSTVSLSSQWIPHWLTPSETPNSRNWQ